VQQYPINIKIIIYQHKLLFNQDWFVCI